MSDLEAIAREALQRAEKATEGPWFFHGAQKAAGEDQWITNDADGDAFDVAFLICEKLEMDYYTHGGRFADIEWRPGTRDERKPEIVQDRRNFEFIAHARTDVPALARGVLELLEERDRLQAADKVAKAARAYFEVEEKRPLYRHRLKDRPAYRQLRRSLDEYEQVEALAPKGEG